MWAVVVSSSPSVEKVHPRCGLFPLFFVKLIRSLLARLTSPTRFSGNADPKNMNKMMTQNMTNMVPMMVVGGVINAVFAGFVTIRVPFPLTLR